METKHTQFQSKQTQLVKYHASQKTGKVREARREGKGKEGSQPALQQGEAGSHDDTGAHSSTRRINTKQHWAVCGTPCRLEKQRKVKKHDYPQ